MTKEQLIKKIKKQAGFVDVLDAYRIVDAYTTLYGVEFFGTQTNPMSVEDQLIIMWDKILNSEKYIEIKEKQDRRKKVCVECKEEYSLSNFHKDRKKKDGHKIRCKACAVRIHQEYIAKRIAEDPYYKMRNNKKSYQAQKIKKGL
jgi:uncharacterized protein (DUF39 family)